MTRAAELSAWLVGHGHDSGSLRRLGVGATNRLLEMESRDRVGWRAGARNAYVICCFLNNVVNSIRALHVSMTGSRRITAQAMPSFDAMFEPEIEARRRSASGLRGLDELDAQIDAFSDS